MTARLKLPSADDLNYSQHQGWACCLCGKSLWTPAGGVSVGRARGGVGAHAYDIEVYACPDCAPGSATPGG